MVALPEGKTIGKPDFLKCQSVILRLLLRHQKTFQACRRLCGIPRVAERGKAKVSFSAFSEARSRGTDDLNFVQQFVKELPTALAAGAFQPDGAFFPP